VPTWAPVLVRVRREPCSVRVARVQTIAEQLEQQATQQQEAEQTNAVIDALESEEAAGQGAPVEITESVMTESDVPDMPADDVVVPAAPGTDDLPE